VKLNKACLLIFILKKTDTCASCEKMSSDEVVLDSDLRDAVKVLEFKWP
jgi:hypothetical protein